MEEIKSQNNREIDNIQFLKMDIFFFSLAPELSSRETASGCRTSGSQATPTTCESGTTETVTAVVTSAEAPISTTTNMLLLQQPQVGFNYKVLHVFYVVQQILYILRKRNLNFTIAPIIIFFLLTVALSWVLLLHKYLFNKI